MPDHPGVREQRAHPGEAQFAGDRIARKRADEDGELVHHAPRGAAQELVAGVGRHELAEDEAARRHAGSASARSFLSQPASPKTHMTRNTA